MPGKMAVKTVSTTYEMRTIFASMPNKSAMAPQTPAIFVFSGFLTILLLKFMVNL